MRVLGIDFGERRVGLALSDPSGTLARPWRVLQVDGLVRLRQGDGPPPPRLRRGLAEARSAQAGGIKEIVDRLTDEIDRLTREEDGLELIVIGLPRRLDGSPNEQTARVRAAADALAARTSVPMAFQDERLTSREAESRLAVRERDWRKRKSRLDAAAAAIILQDFLDGHRTPQAAPPSE